MFTQTKNQKLKISAKPPLIQQMPNTARGKHKSGKK